MSRRDDDDWTNQEFTVVKIEKHSWDEGVSLTIREYDQYPDETSTESLGEKEADAFFDADIREGDRVECYYSMDGRRYSNWKVKGLNLRDLLARIERLEERALLKREDI